MNSLIVLSLVLTATLASPLGLYRAPAPHPIVYSGAPKYQAPAISYAVDPTIYAAPSKSVHAAPAAYVASSQYHGQDSLGRYSFGYTSSDGQAKVESRGDEGTVAGKYSYVDPDGETIELKYVADKDGFRAEGDHLPKAPEVPELPEHLKKAYDEAESRLAEAKTKDAEKGDSETATDEEENGESEPSPASPQKSIFLARPVGYAAVPAPAVGRFETYTKVLEPEFPIQIREPASLPAPLPAKVSSFKTYAKVLESQFPIPKPEPAILPAQVYAPAQVPVISIRTYKVPTPQEIEKSKPAYLSAPVPAPSPVSSFQTYTKVLEPQLPIQRTEPAPLPATVPSPVSSFQTYTKVLEPQLPIQRAEPAPHLTSAIALTPVRSFQPYTFVRAEPAPASVSGFQTYTKSIQHQGPILKTAPAPLPAPIPAAHSYTTVLHQPAAPIKSIEAPLAPWRLAAKPAGSKSW